MYTVETSVVMAVVMISISMFLNFSFSLERRINNDINQHNNRIRKEYDIDGKRVFKPEKIQRIIKNIDYIKEEE